MGLQDVFFKMGLPVRLPGRSRRVSRRISEEIYFNALWASTELAEANGPHAAFAETRAAAGDLQFDLWGVEPTDAERWAPLRDRIETHGLRNSLMIAIAPTATIASIAGCYECIEPQVSNLFKRETLSGEFMQINRYLVKELQRRGLWDAEMIADVKKAEGSIQDIARIPDDLKEIYRTAWEIPMKSLIEMAADRGAFIDQSQSLNLFMEAPTIGKLSSMYMYAWKAGLKTTYYLRSRPATRINKTTTGGTDGGPRRTRRWHRRRRSPTKKPSPARWRTPSPARRATDGTRRRSHLDGIGRAGLRTPATPGHSRRHRPAAGPTSSIPGFNLTLRPMRYPQFFDMYKDAIKNTWTVEEIDFSDDLTDLDRKLMPAEKHLISRLVAFFATGDSIVANNLVLNLYEHINAPEARMYLSRQLYEEALHVQFYLNLLDNYIPDHDERAEAFAAIENIPSIRAKAEFCFKWMESSRQRPARDRRGPQAVPA